MIEIDENIEIPSGIHNAKYPFGRMSVGNSLLDGDAATTQSSKVYAAARVYGVRNGWKFKGRTIAGEGVRIWRTK